jgi:hypothetical protein
MLLILPQSVIAAANVSLNCCGGRQKWRPYIQQMQPFCCISPLGVELPKWGITTILAQKFYAVNMLIYVRSVS